MNRFVSFVLSFFLYCLPSYSQTTVIGEEIYGYSDMENAITKIATKSRTSKINFIESTFPTWELSHRDYRIDVGKRVKLSLLPEGAFTISPQIVEIKNRGQTVVFRVSLTNPKCLFNKNGDIKKLGAWIQESNNADVKFDFSTTTESADVFKNLSGEKDRDDFQPVPVKDEILSMESKPINLSSNEVALRAFTFKDEIRINEGQSLLVFLPTILHRTNANYSLTPGSVAIYFNSNYLKKGLLIKGNTRIHATDWNDRPDSTTWTFYFDNEPWIDKIEFVRGSCNNSIEDLQKKVSSLLNFKYRK